MGSFILLWSNEVDEGHKNAQNVLMTNLKTSDHCADIGADGSLILKHIKQMGPDDMEWTYLAENKSGGF